MIGILWEKNIIYHPPIWCVIFLYNLRQKFCGSTGARNFDSIRTNMLLFLGLTISTLRTSLARWFGIIERSKRLMLLRFKTWGCERISCDEAVTQLCPKKKLCPGPGSKQMLNMWKQSNSWRLMGPLRDCRPAWGSGRGSLNLKRMLLGNYESNLWLAPISIFLNIVWQLGLRRAGTFCQA